jgi:long-chain fatty acid transport protein
VPDQTGVTNLIDADRHTITVGVGLSLNAPFDELPGSLELDVHGMFSILPERTTLKDNPADFVGDYTAGGNIFGGGGTMKVAF